MWFVALLVAASIGLLFEANSAHAATTFTVNRTGDAQDANLSNDRCDVNTSASGNQCTLRAAIQEANDTLGADIIRFNILSEASVKTIAPNSTLPTITEAVTINGYSQPGASPNTLAQANDAVLTIELNGTNAGEDTNGLEIEASESTIRGLVINRFGESGILISGSGATRNRVLGNFIGTDASGTTRYLGNRDGVKIIGASNNTVGGTQAGARNVISGNYNGIGVRMEGSGATDNKVLGNFIGTTADGSGDLGNRFNGVFIASSNNTVGGTESGAGNIISGNDESGVHIQNISAQSYVATDNKVEGNAITNNGLHGVVILASASGNTIGSGNLIFGNGADGVSVASGSTGNSILSNRIFANGGLGIDLSPNGVTNNDPDDPDIGPNNLQNFPLITSAKRRGNLTTINGTLNSTPNQSFTIQCFVSNNDDSSHGEGQTFVGQDTSVQTNSAGDGSFSCTSALPQLGQVVSATATNTATGDTSEFSKNVVVRFEL